MWRRYTRGWLGMQATACLLPCIRLCCLATVRLCRWVARPLPELRNGCLPWVCTGGGWARCCYDTEVPIYKGVSAATHAVA